MKFSREKGPIILQLFVELHGETIVFQTGDPCDGKLDPIQKRRELGIWTGTSDNRIGGIIPVVGLFAASGSARSFRFLAEQDRGRTRL